VGASTDQAQEAIAREAVRIVAEFARGAPVPSCVNLTARSPARWLLVVRHYDKVGVLAGVLELLRRGRINVQEVDNRVFDGAQAAVCRLRLDERPGDELLAELAARRDEILHVELTEA
jgi:D-3-phosphoglycerate dehydrogenase